MDKDQPTAWATFALLLGIAAIGSNSLVLSPILTDVATDLSAQPDQIARAAAAYGGATAFAALFLGRLVDSHGARLVMLIGGVVLGIGTLASAAAMTWWQLSLAQAIAGIAAGAMIPAIYATATTIGTPQQGAKVLGRVLIGWSLSLVIGVPIAAAIADAFGWRATFLALTGVVAISLIGFALMRIPKRSQPDSPKSTGIWNALSISGVPHLLGIQFLFMGTFYGFYPFFGDHLRTTLSLSTSQAGLVILAYGVGFGLAGFTDKLTEFIEPKKILVSTLLWSVLVYVGMDHIMTAFASACFVAIIWGFGNHLIVSLVVQRLSQRSDSQRGSILGLNSSVTYFGSMVGPLAFGPIYVLLGFGTLTLVAAVCLAAAALVSIKSK